MQANRDLNQPLQEFLFPCGSGSPNVLPDFVRVIEIGQIEEFHASVKALRIHTFILAQGAKTGIDLYKFSYEGAARITIVTSRYKAISLEVQELVHDGLERNMRVPDTTIST